MCLFSLMSFGFTALKERKKKTLHLLSPSQVVLDWTMGLLWKCRNPPPLSDYALHQEEQAKAKLIPLCRHQDATGWRLWLRWVSGNKKSCFDGHINPITYFMYKIYELLFTVGQLVIYLILSFIWSLKWTCHMLTWTKVFNKNEFEERNLVS